MFTKNMASLSVVAFAAVCLLAAPSVGRADTIADWTIAGTVSWSTDRDITNNWGIGSFSPGTLNQTAGTITYTNTTGYGCVIGQLTTGVYNMSGTAKYITLRDMWVGNYASGYGIDMGTWTLTDSATVQVGAVDVSRADPTLVSSVLLAGNASLSATDLVIGNLNYVSFASGSVATLTVADKVLGDYQALVSSGYIRINGATVSDFNGNFQVVNTHTLELKSVPEPGTLALLAAGLIGLLCYASRKRK